MRASVLRRALLGAAAACWTASAYAATAPDALSQRLRSDSLPLLQSLVRANTTNPPGNETAAARLLGARLKAAGIPFEIFESTPGRASLVARLKGDGTRRPLLLVAHLDVVPVEAERWSLPPFAAEIKDGFVYGRGAMDDKGMVAGLAAAMIEAKRSGLALKRDLILIAEADEETGGREGLRWLLKNHPEAVDGEFALNEGGSTELRDGRVLRVAVQAAEKRYHDVRITARGNSGHASIPLRDNAIYALARALGRIQDAAPPVRLNPVTRAYFTGMAPLLSEAGQAAVRDLLSDDPRRVESGAAELAAERASNGALLRDTIAPTVLSAGYALNVVPSQAWANLNCRLLPDSDTDAFLSRLTGIVGDPAVEVSVVERPDGAAPPLMPLDSALYAALAAAAGRLWPQAPVVPYMSSGATDSEYLRRAGVLAYGIGFPLEARDEARMHGDDERMPVDGLVDGARWVYETIVEMNR